MDYFRKNSNRGVEDMEFPKDIEKKQEKKKRVNKKKKFVKFPKVLGLGNSNGYNTNLWDFQGEASFCLEFRPCLDYFWNSLMASKSLINN